MEKLLNFVQAGRKISVEWEGNKYKFITTKTMPSGEKAKKEDLSNKRTAIGFGRNNEIIEVSKENLNLWKNGKHVKVGFGSYEIVEEVKEKDITQEDDLGISKKPIGFNTKEITEEQLKEAVENKLFMAQHNLRPMVTGFRSKVEAMADLNHISIEDAKATGITEQEILAVPVGLNVQTKATGFGKTEKDLVSPQVEKAALIEMATNQGATVIQQAIERGLLPKDLNEKEFVQLIKEFSNGYLKLMGVNPEPEKSNMVAGFGREVPEGTKSEFPKHNVVKGFAIPEKTEAVEPSVAPEKEEKKEIILKNRIAHRDSAEPIRSPRAPRRISAKKIADTQGR